jgi:hypothetical protein
MRQPGRGGRCRPRSLGAWPRGTESASGLFSFALDQPEHAEPRVRPGRQRLVVASGYQEREICPRSGGCVITWSAAAAVLGPGRQSSHRPARAGAAAGLPWRANQAECRCRRLPNSPSRGFSRPSARPVRDPYSTCGCKPSCSGVKRSGNWAELRKERDWLEAACVIGRRREAVRPGRIASTLPVSAARHRRRVLRTG